jgi:hypothetical protein
MNELPVFIDLKDEGQAPGWRPYIDKRSNICLLQRFAKPHVASAWS